jgi:hypothetical protein
MNEQEIQKLRAAGFTDDDIREYSSSQTSRSTQPGSQSQADQRDARGPELDPTAPSETLSRARESGVPTEGRESSFLSDVATIAPVVAGQYAVPIAAAAGGGAALYGANQLRKGMQARAGAQTATAAAQQAQAQAMMEQARAAQMQSQGLQDRFAQRQATQTARVAPGSQLLGPNGQPMRPVAPQMAPPAAPAMAPPAPTMAPPVAAPAAQPSMLNRMVSAAAPYARTAARVAGPAAVMYEGLQPGTVNAGEQQQLAQMQSPESVAETQRNRQAIAQAGRQPTSSADLDQMIRAAAARRALMMGQQGQ